MSDVSRDNGTNDPGGAADGDLFLRLPRKITTWLIIATLAWLPFPLGSATGWSTGLSILLVALCWTAWTASIWSAPGPQAKQLVELRTPALLLFAVLAWAIFQICPIAPDSWTHPLWKIASTQLGRRLPDVISINPWRTLAEIAKLTSCLAMGWIAASLGRLTKPANQMLDAVIYIAAFYALYGLFMAFLGRQQVSFFYAIYPQTVLVSGPFMLHNSFATYEGIGFIAAATRLVAAGAKVVNIKSGYRPFAVTLLHLLTGSGAGLTIAGILTLSSVAISGSRAGFASVAGGALFTALFALAALRLNIRRSWPLLAGAAMMMVALFYVFATSSVLGDRYNDLFLNPHIADKVRPMLWHAAWRMVIDAPWFGMGLGTFQDAYPLYGSVVLPYVVDKAHCDYLELAAGLGVPAAAALLLGLALLVLRCIRGVFVRRRNQVFCLVAAGCSILVALHSAVDFSLQIPAVALQYAVVLGLGVAQSRRSQS